MKNKGQGWTTYRQSWARAGLVTSLLIITTPSAALGPELDEDLGAQSLCVGATCAVGTTTPEQVRLQDEVVRLRFIDSSASNTTADGLGNSWSLLANDYGGARDPQSYFGVTLRSIDPNQGTAGNAIVGKHMLRLGPATPVTGGGGAIGYESALIEGVVTLGSENRERRLVHVAQATESGDALTKRQLEAGFLGTLGAIADRLDEMEVELAALERRAASESSGGSGGSSKNGGGGAIGLTTLAFLALWLGRAWKRRPIRIA